MQWKLSLYLLNRQIFNHHFMWFGCFLNKGIRSGASLNYYHILKVGISI
jgi:hypothetical protein